MPGWDYAAAGLYSVTICVQDRACVFGEVVGDTVRLSASGAVAQACWEAIPKHHPRVALDAFVVMPNHVHGVIGLRGGAPTRVEVDTRQRPGPGSLGTAVGTYKAAVTIEVRRNVLKEFRWQRSYYEHIVCSERELDRLRKYNEQNPLRWGLDRDNPAQRAGSSRARGV